MPRVIGPAPLRPTNGPEIADWIEDNLTGPDGAPIVLTGEQRHALYVLAEY